MKPKFWLIKTAPCKETSTICLFFFISSFFLRSFIMAGLLFSNKGVCCFDTSFFISSSKPVPSHLFTFYSITTLFFSLFSGVGFVNNYFNLCRWSFISYSLFFFPIFNPSMGNSVSDKKSSGDELPEISLKRAISPIRLLSSRFGKRYLSSTSWPSPRKILSKWYSWFRC